MILHEEYEEAQDQLGLWFVATCAMAFFFVLFLSLALEPEQANRARATLVPTVASAIVAVFCAAGCLRCRRTIKAWRDQKKLEVAMREVDKMGGGK